MVSAGGWLGAFMATAGVPAGSVGCRVSGWLRRLQQRRQYFGARPRERSWLARLQSLLPGWLRR
jgi:hypothetical protein